MPEVVPLIREYVAERPENSLGGVLHIVLADGNIKDSHVRWCIEKAAEIGDTTGEALARTLLAMSRTQRHKLYSMGILHG